MSDNGSERPLTRKERRQLEEQQEAQLARGSVDAEPQEELAPVIEAPDQDPAVASEDEFDFDEEQLVYATVDDEGNPLSRREVRQLREDAIAVLRAQHEAQVAQAAEAAALEAEAAEDEALKDEASEDFNAHDVSTQAFSLEDLQEIEDENSEVADTEVADTEEAEAAEETVEVIDSVEGFEELLEESGVEPEIVDAEPTATTVIETTEEEPPEDQASTSDDEYSFPDIKPLEVDRPIFDDPSVRTVGTPGTSAQGTGFDDMIERAVADETASVHTGTSSLILPTIPGNDDLSGAIGSTGELFVTGSFELPKSIGETGGHSKLQDSIDGEGSEEEQDATDMLNLTDMYETSEFDSAPVSASQAVSTRSLDKSGITAPEVQHDNKKSLIWMGTGAGLILVLIGAGIWVAKSGLFG